MYFEKHFTVAFNGDSATLVGQHATKPLYQTKKTKSIFTQNLLHVHYNSNIQQPSSGLASLHLTRERYTTETINHGHHGEKNSTQ